MPRLIWTAAGCLCFLLVGCGESVGPGPGSDDGLEPGPSDGPRPATCGDSIRNADESDVDCGGSCGACSDGRGCGAASDCVSRSCTGGKCAPSSCADQVKNGMETDVDCGGGCPPCGDGLVCAAPADCKSGVCAASRCAAPTCSDKVRNGAETDIDCGGGTCASCAEGRRCAEARDCVTGVCRQISCAPATCDDKLRNGDESDVDCGGACGGCAAGLKCGAPKDCASGVCTGGLCAAPACDDRVKNGQETDVDCGGSCPKKCADRAGCAMGSDCVSLVCSGGSCAAPSCNDGVKNGNESDLDCGAACNPRCADGRACGVPADCTSGVCTMNACQKPACNDGVKNGAETAVDCGGGQCAACTDGAACVAGSDCVSLVCTMKVCLAPTCKDGIKNQAETDLDCGAMCPGCAVGQACLVNADCATMNCLAKACAAPAPTIAAVTPSASPLGAATVVAITGTNFAPNATVTVGGIAASTVSVTPKRITARVPISKMAAQTTIVVTNPDKQTASTAFRYASWRGLDFAAARTTSLLLTNSLASGDFDSDGKLDVVTFTKVIGTLYAQALLGNGDGTFRLPQALAVTNSLFTTTSIHVIELTGDGKPDLLYTIDNGPYVASGNGDGTFQPGVRFTPPVDGKGNTVTSVVDAGAIDVDGDKKLDLVALGKTADGSVVSVFTGNGNGGFVASATYNITASLPALLGLADLNSDGYGDVLVLTTSGMLYPAASVKGLTIQPLAPAMLGPIRPNTMVLRSMDQNGTLDAVVGGDNGVAFCGGDGKGGFAVVRQFGVRARVSSVNGLLAQPIAVGDFNNDKIPDVAQVGPSDEVALFFQDQFINFKQGPASYGPGGATYEILAGDFDNDGLDDLVTRDRTGISFLANDGGKGFRSAVMWDAQLLTNRQLYLGDADSDGLPEFMPTGKYTNDLYAMPGDGTLVQVGTRNSDYLGWTFGDFDADGKVDLVTGTGIWFRGDGTPKFPNNGISLKFGLVTTENIGSADVTGDGLPDLFGPTGGQVTIWANQMNLLVNGLRPAVTIPTGGSPAAPVFPDDLDGDGKVDLVTTDPQNGSVVVLLNAGNLLFAPLKLAAGMGTNTVAAGDLNGDGGDDLVAGNQMGNDVSVLLQTAPKSGKFQPAVHYPATGSTGPVRTVLADLDGDAVLDIVLVGGDTGFNVLVGNGDGTFKPRRTFAAPYPAQSVLVTDFNGDGKPDVILGPGYGNVNAYNEQPPLVLLNTSK